MANKVMMGVFAVIPSALALGTVLNVMTPAAHAFEVERTRGSNKAGRIVRTDKTKTSTPVVKSEPESRRSTITIRGNHGAQKRVTQEGVGGPARGEYKGFPRLEQRGSHGAYRIAND